MYQEEMVKSEEWLKFLRNLIACKSEEWLKFRRNLIACKSEGWLKFLRNLITCITIKKFTKNTYQKVENKKIVKKIFMKSGHTRFIINNVRYMYTLHVNGSIDNNAINHIFECRRPINCGSKPMMYSNINYVWSSSNPICKNSWIAWCKSEMPHWIQGDYYGILTDMTTILDITSPAEFEAFHLEYHILDINQKDIRKCNIDWGRVSNDYSGGIAIMNYFYEFRFTYDWYYTWDVDSHVIWGKNTIKDIDKLTYAEKKILEL